MLSRASELLLAFALCACVEGWVLYSPLQRSVSHKAYAYPPNRAWEGPQSFSLDHVPVRWSLPQETDSNEGLGGGITFALHRSFCERLLPVFPEGSGFGAVLGTWFLTCDELRDTVKRAMDTWAINHRKIYFRDVTDLCADVERTDACPHAELFIVPDYDGETQTASGDLAAFVRHYTDTIDTTPYTTAGVQLHPGLGVRRAKMTIRAPQFWRRGDFCWCAHAAARFAPPMALPCRSPFPHTHTHTWAASPPQQPLSRAAASLAPTYCTGTGTWTQRFATGSTRSAPSTS
jgi:hypothetical protein